MITSHKCGHCNRTLRDLDSVAIGYGPVCYKKLFGKELPRTDERTKTTHKSRRRMLKSTMVFEDLDEVFKDV